MPRQKLPENKKNAFRCLSLSLYQVTAYMKYRIVINIVQIEYK